MSDRIENLRLAFPAEVTAAYFGAVQLMNELGTPTENENLGILIIVLLLIGNFAIYTRFYEVKSKLYYAFVSLGFLVWVLNIDGQRYNDYLAGHAEIIGGVSIIFYPIVAMFFTAPNPLKTVSAQ